MKGFRFFVAIVFTIVSLALRMAWDLSVLRSKLLRKLFKGKIIAILFFLQNFISTFCKIGVKLE